MGRACSALRDGQSSGTEQKATVEALKWVFPGEEDDDSSITFHRWIIIPGPYNLVLKNSVCYDQGTVDTGRQIVSQESVTRETVEAKGETTLVSLPQHYVIVLQQYQQADARYQQCHLDVQAKVHAYRHQLEAELLRPRIVQTELLKGACRQLCPPDGSIPLVSREKFHEAFAASIPAFQAKQYPEAKQHCETALLNADVVRSYNKGIVLYNTACACSLLNEVQAAMSYLQQAYRLDIWVCELAHSDHDLDNLRDLDEFKQLLVRIPRCVPLYGHGIASGR